MRNAILLFTILCIALLTVNTPFAQNYENVEQVNRFGNYWYRAYDV
ncbi:MAG: hypothetical protein P9X24_11990 [Candidatus Hatepunaea meridiana]|nr:hypothetical protein [Candidatus Hatepunaea meridiana]